MEPTWPIAAAPPGDTAGPYVNPPKRAIEHVNDVSAEEFVPLAIITRGPTGQVTRGIEVPCLPLVGRITPRDIGGHEARKGDQRRLAGRGFGKAHRKIVITAAICADHGRLVLRERIGLPAIDRVALKRIVGRAVWTQIEVPDVDARGHAANRARVMVAEVISAIAGFGVLCRNRNFERVTGAELDAALELYRRPGPQIRGVDHARFAGVLVGRRGCEINRVRRVAI